MARNPSSKSIPFSPSITPAKALSRLKRLLGQLSEVSKAGRDSTLATTWPRDIKVVLADFYGRDSTQFMQFDVIDFTSSAYRPGQREDHNEPYFRTGLAESEAFLKSRILELEDDLADQVTAPKALGGPAGSANSHKVFVVHGHDKGMRETVARYLSKLGLEPIILHERANEGRTIIEKFEHHADVGCAVVLLSPDDVGASSSDPSKLEGRARQNVIFEMGFFFAWLGRSKTIALLQKGVTKPSDIDGVLYISMVDESWELLLVRELKAAGLDIDANKVFA
jgi:predicted nucleotide-binding protein